MATKAQLEAELAELRAQLAKAQSDADQTADQPDSDEPRGVFDDMMTRYGLNHGELDALWAQFSKELGDFPTQKPMLTTIAAFALGVMLGRLTKS